MASRDETLTFTYKIVGDDQIAASAVTMAKAGTAASGASEEVIKLSDALKTAATNAKLIDTALSQKSGLADLKSQLAEAQAGLAKLNTEFDKTDTSNKKVTRAFNDAEKAVASLTTQVNQQQVALAKTEGALAKAGVDTTNLSAAYTKVASEGNAAANSLAAIGQASAKAATGTKDAASGTKSLGDESKKTSGLLDELKEHLLSIVSAATAIELAFKGVEFGKESISGAADVQATLSRIKVTAEGASEEFDKLGDAIEKSARAANVSDGQAAAAALALAQQGQKATEIFQTLTPTLLLAKAANIEVGESAKIVDDILDLFGKDASQAADAVDKLVAASKGSREGLTGMAAAITQLAPDAKQLGISFDQLVGTLGFLQQNGLDTAKAVRGLRTVFQELQDPASKFSQALSAIGDNSADFRKAITAIRDGGKEGQQALLSLSGASRSLVALLAQQAPDAVDKFTASLATATGAAASTAKAIDDNLGGSFKAFENAIDRAGEKLATPILTPLADEFSKLAKQINDFSDSEEFSGLADKFGTLFSNAAKAFDTFISHIDWDSFVKGAQDAVDNAGQSINDLKKDFDDLGVAINSVGKFFANLSTLDQAGGKALNGFVEGLHQLGIASVALSEQNLPGVTSALDAAKASFGQGSDAAKEFSNTLDGTSTQFANVKAGVESIAESTATMADGVGKATDELGKLGDVGPGVFENTAAAANKTAEAVRDQNQAILEAEAAVDKAHKAFEDLVRSGNGSAEAMLEAKKAYDDASAALDKLRGTTDKTAESQAELERAFATLGITTQEKLDQAAKAASNALEEISRAFLAGNATLADVQRAYDAYAKTVRAAVADSTSAIKSEAEAQLATKAALLDVTDSAKKAGDAAEDAGRRGAKAFGDTTEAVGKTKKAIEDASDSTSSWAQKIDDFNSGSQQWADSLAQAATAAASASAGVTLLSNEQLRLLREVRDEWLSGALTAEQYAERVKVAFGGIDEELQKQEDQLRAFNDAVNELQSQLASASGDNVEVENLRHAKKLQDLKDEQDLSTAQRAELERLEEQLHEANLKRIKEENDARGNGTGTNSHGGGTGGHGGGSGSGGTSPPPAPPPPPPAPPPAPPPPHPPLAGTVLNFTINGILDNKGLDDLSRKVKKIIDDINGRGR